MTKYILCLISLILITGCTINPPKTEAGKAVYISTKKPKSCQYIGQVYSSVGNWFTGIFTPNIDVLMNSRNKLRDQAAANGANYIQLQGTYANDTALFVGGNQNIVFVGQAYHCDNLKKVIKEGLR